MRAIIVIGLGYVGLPLAAAFGTRFRTIGFDVSRSKIELLKKRLDPTGMISPAEFEQALRLEFSCDPACIQEGDFVVVAVPTPVDEVYHPDLTPLTSVSEMIGRNLKRGATIVFESTVYPGATEDVCIPIIEKFSGLKWKQDFFVGYSPERINPGDHQHLLPTVVKLVSGDLPETLERVAETYASIIPAGIHKVSNIKVAEAAKVIENIQRDINIALMNEFAKICHRIGIDTLEVLAAAGTKWNFLPFRPGLVGGHCIGVDPYYLVAKAGKLGFYPQVILAGRQINNDMGKYIAEQTVKQLVRNGFPLHTARVSVLGITFKENVSDLRNSRVLDIINELKAYGATVSVHDPFASAEEAERSYGIRLCPWEELPPAHAIVAAVAHEPYKEISVEQLLGKLVPGGVLVDVKSQFDAPALRSKGIDVWRL
jgi:UDP-N-acetyl-D-galactosamine dehydrogenase